MRESDFSRRRFLSAMGTAALLALGGRMALGQAPKRPNFIFFLVDDMGWRDLGCYGSTFYETPAIDALAKQGMRFTDAYAAGPVCSPTCASIMTGKYPARLGLTDFIGGANKRKLLPPVYPNHLGLDETTLGRAFKEAGYVTGFVGKWHLGGKGFWPENQGFDVNVGGLDWGSPKTYFSPYGNPKIIDGPPGEYLTDRLTDESLKFIESNREKPFLLYLSHYSVHIPQQAKKDMIEKYKAKAAAMGEPAGPKFLPEGNTRTRQVQDVPTYAAMVQSTDESLGRLIKKLEELGLAENTVIILMSDNGGLATAEGWPTSNLPLRGQGLAVRGRNPRADDRQVAGRDQGRQRVQRAGDEQRLLSDDAGNGGPAGQATAALRWREPGSAAARRGPVAARGDLLALPALQQPGGRAERGGARVIGS